MSFHSLKTESFIKTVQEQLDEVSKRLLFDQMQMGSPKLGIGPHGYYKAWSGQERKLPRRWKGGIPEMPTENWTWKSVDSGSEMPCAWCGEMARFHHELTHSETGKKTTAGLVCVEYLTNDYIGPRKAEKKLKDSIYTRRKSKPKPLPLPDETLKKEQETKGKMSVAEFIKNAKWKRNANEFICLNFPIKVLTPELGRHFLEIKERRGGIEFFSFYEAVNHAAKVLKSMGELE